MGILTRIIKVFAALLTSNGVNLISRLVLPPIFLYRYGATLYGEWIALSGAVAYLSTLNFGIQTYVTHDLTIRYQQQNLESYHRQQSTSLRVLLGILGAASMLTLLVFGLPAKHLLHLTISQSTAVLTLYLLAIQVLLSILFKYFTGIYTVLSRAHLGVLWVNGQRLAMVLLTSFGVWRYWSFPILAACQLGTYVLATVLVLLHVRRIAPEIFPQVQGWDRSVVRGILRPSGYFGLISWSTFLSYEIPVLILQREIGPVVVVAFTVMRTIFSMCRQALNALTQSLGPEITRLYGREEWSTLTRVYGYSERLLFALIPTVNLGVLVISPVLLGLWLHKTSLFSVFPYMCMAAISMTLSAKEHKFQFQYSTNTHEPLARLMFASYLTLAVIAIPLVYWLGLVGFLLAWLVVELYQTSQMLQLNQQLFAHTGERMQRYILRLVGLSSLGLATAGWLLRQTWTEQMTQHIWTHQIWVGSYGMQLAMSLGTSFIFGGVAFWLFDLRPMTQQLQERLRRR